MSCRRYTEANKIREGEGKNNTQAETDEELVVREIYVCVKDTKSFNTVAVSRFGEDCECGLDARLCRTPNVEDTDVVKVNLRAIEHQRSPLRHEVLLQDVY